MSLISVARNSVADWGRLMGPNFWVEAHALAKLLTGPDVYPGWASVFQAFREVAPEDVRVVILGQDPYHSPGKARGVAFGYHPTYTGPINSSLANIITECGGNIGTADTDRFDTTLTHWTEQGVLLLNTRLTVPHEQPMGHAGKGWEPLMDEVLARICEHVNPVVLAWGREARLMANRSPSNTIIDTSHPCRYSATRGHRPFLGSGCFQQVNRELVKRGQQPINWTGE